MIKTYQRHALVHCIGLTLLIIAVLCSCAKKQPPPPADRATEQRGKPRMHVSSLEKKIHVLVNHERQKQGLQPLAWDDSLAAIARTHSKDMTARNYFAHDSPEGYDFSYRYKQASYACNVRVDRTIYMGAENLAQNNLYNSVTTMNGVPTSYDWNSEDKLAESTVQGWMNSPGHRKNILTPHFKSEGIGIFIAPDDKVYVTQNFC